MATLGDMKTRIADELARTDLTTQIAKAITSAISFYDGEAFAGPSSTVFSSGQRLVTIRKATAPFSINPLTAGFTSQSWYVDDIKTLTYIGPNSTDALRIPLIRLTQMEFVEKYANSQAYGVPQYFALYGENVYLWPLINSNVYFEAWIDERQTTAGAPAASDSTDDFWTNEAEELIRTHAKVDLLENVIRSEEAFSEAERLRVRETQVLAKMRTRTARLYGSGRVVAWQV